MLPRFLPPALRHLRLYHYYLPFALRLQVLERVVHQLPLYRTAVMPDVILDPPVECVCEPFRHQNAVKVPQVLYGLPDHDLVIRDGDVPVGVIVVRPFDVNQRQRIAAFVKVYEVGDLHRPVVASEPARAGAATHYRPVLENPTEERLALPDVGKVKNSRLLLFDLIPAKVGEPEVLERQGAETLFVNCTVRECVA